MYTRTLFLYYLFISIFVVERAYVMRTNVVVHARRWNRIAA